MSKKNATAKVAEVPRETAAQARARERAEQRAAREKVRKVFDRNESITDLEQLAKKAGVDHSTAHNALDAPRFRTLGRRAKADLKARVRAAYKAQRPNDWRVFCQQFGNEASFGQVQDALTKPQQTALNNREAKRIARAEREREKERVRKQRVQDRLTERFEARSARRAKCAIVIADGAKPSKLVSSNEGKPILEHARITRVGRGDDAHWLLDVCDGYQLARFPLKVLGDAGLKDGQLIPREALQAIDKTGAFRITPNGQIVQPVTASGTVKYSRSYYGMSPGQDENEPPTEPDRYREWSATEAGTGYAVQRDGKIGRYPKLRQLVPKAPKGSNRIELAVDPGLLKQLADGIGKAARSNGGVRLVLNARQLEKKPGGARCARKAVLVESYDINGKDTGVEALVMPKAR